jgi:outer membrane protein TolC
LQNLVLEALQLYWNTYVAQENFKEALSSRERYEKFVGVLKKKTAYGYSNNYEVFQIQAELENREQVIKTTSAEYLKNSELIIQLLNLPKGAILEFPNIEAIPDIPAHQNKEIKQLRSLKSQNAKIKAAEASLVASQSTRFPLLALTGSLSTSGYDENPSITESHLISGSFPKYSVGIKFATTFGSDFTSQDLFNKRTTLDLEKTRLQRIEEETENKMSTAERKIETTYFSVQSIKKQVDLRQKTLNEMQRSYNDGRMDISFLIDGMNKLFSTQILYTRSIGDYFIALNELAALNDELIINTQEVH